MAQKDMWGRDTAADALTLAALGVMAYFSASQVHELVGHGGACVALGGRLSLLTAEYASCDGALSDARLALLRVSGAIGNVALGVLCFLLLPKVRRGWPRFCLWLIGTVNVLTAAGYLMFSAWTGMGDWGELLRSLPGGAFTRIGVGALGLMASIALSRLAAARLPIVGAPLPYRRLLLIPYLAGCAVAIVAGGLNPRGPVFAGVAAGASLAATCWLVLDIPRHAAQRPHDTSPPEQMPMQPWLVAAGVVLTAAFLIVGRGLTSSGR